MRRPWYRLRLGGFAWRFRLGIRFCSRRGDGNGTAGACGDSRDAFAVKGPGAQQGDSCPGARHNAGDPLREPPIFWRRGSIAQRIPIASMGRLRKPQIYGRKTPFTRLARKAPSRSRRGWIAPAGGRVRWPFRSESVAVGCTGARWKSGHHRRRRRSRRATRGRPSSSAAGGRVALGAAGGWRRP